MFVSIYRTTLKNLVRSVLFWLMFALLIGIPFMRAVQGFHGYYSMELGEMIMDTDPRYILDVRCYVQSIANTCSSTMLYAMPLFAIVSVALILSRDYGDGFYEVERAGGRRPIHFLFGRITTLLTVNFLAFLVVVFFANHWYVFTRGGVDGMETGTYLWDSTVRILRHAVCLDWPSIVMYICFTYAMGTVFRNGWAAAAVASGYVLLNYLFNRQLQFRIPKWYGEYLAPAPKKLQYYLHYYDSPWFEQTLESMKTSLSLAIGCLGILLGAAAVYCLISYLRIRCREI